jgi:hypothetical protein
MGNTVLSKRAAADLHRYAEAPYGIASDIIGILTMHPNVYSMKSKQPERFHQPHLFRKTLSILESHHFRLPARRFALDLFDKSVMRRIVMEDECDSDSEATSSQESS